MPPVSGSFNPIPRPPSSPPAEILRGFAFPIKNLPAEDRAALYEELLRKRLPAEVQNQIPRDPRVTDLVISNIFVSQLLGEQPPLTTDTIGELAQLDSWARQLANNLSTGAISQADVLRQLDEQARQWAGLQQYITWALIGLAVLVLVLFLKGR